MENLIPAKDESKNWFSDLSWKTALLSAILALVVGGGSGAGIVATKAVKAEGISQQEGDLRYLKLDDADRRSAKRDQQADRLEQKIDEVLKKLDDKYVRKDIYEQNIESSKLLLQQILENQKAGRTY